ncbi:hypothetical protein BDN72DRAFT_962450 [Pluteus cervinus]|uniref:Uncharacterized protein n=1 Tax=Pluteus cervinus TaxID=181527 RepID=A0ACD3AIN9_9AGAR|nr:hypothetical protein BDN72DRAFT_962450 [Pluteus cervinus]
MRGHEATSSLLLQVIMDVHTVIVDFQDMSLEKAESQIRTLQHYIQKLRAARNALLPVYRLPLDILLDIFALVGKRWALNLTWVSHHWRELVLRSPSMWTVVTNWNLSRTDELIRRSGSAPLSIRLSNISQKLAEAFERQLESLFAQMPRIQTLHCCQEGWGVHELTLPKLSHALLLSSIKLERVNIHGNFLSQIPNVTDVFLKRCRCSWESDAANFPYLTSLHIIFPYSTVSVGQFTRILHKMPSLELLVVVDAFSLQPDQRVFLPSLALEGPRLHTLNANPAVLEEDWLAHLLTTFSQLVSPKQIVTVKGTHPAPGNSFSTLSLNYQEIGQEICRINLDVEICKQQRIALLSTFRQCLTLTHVKAYLVDFQISTTLIFREQTLSSSSC